MRWHGLLAALTCLSPVANAVFADDAFHIDYHHALLGKPQPHATFLHRPQAASNASLLYTISDKAVLGAINPRDGALLWRHPLAGQPLSEASTSYLVHGDRDGQIVSGYDGTVAAWDAFDGRLIWEYRLPAGTSVAGLQTVPYSGSTTPGAPQDVVVIAAPSNTSVHASVIRIAADGSTPRWTYEDSASGTIASTSLAISPTQVYYVTKNDGLLPGGKVKVVALDSSTGKQAASSNMAVDAEGLGGNGLFSPASCSSFPFLVSSEKPYTAVRLTLLSSSKTVTLELQRDGREIEHLQVHYACDHASSSHFLLYIKTKVGYSAEVYQVDQRTNEVVKAYDIHGASPGHGSVATSSDGTTVYFIITGHERVDMYSSASSTKLASWDRSDLQRFKSEDWQPGLAVAEVINRGTTFAIRIAESSTSGEWTLIRDGDIQWRRFEPLAYATTAAWSDKPDPDVLADELEVEAAVNPVTAYLHRLKRHAHDLLSLPAYLQALPKAIVSPSSEAEGASRRKLVGSKWVVVGTSRKEVGVLDASNGGNVRWWRDLSKHCAPDAKIKHIIVNKARAEVFFSDGALIILDTSSNEIVYTSEGRTPQQRLFAIPGIPDYTLVRVSADSTLR